MASGRHSGLTKTTDMTPSRERVIFNADSGILSVFFLSIYLMKNVR